jgi:hypothetical protein
VAVDGKLERWEWLHGAGSRALKGDAVDHAFGHDLAGCQPLLWDVAGARAELGLSRDEACRLARRLVPGAGRAAVALFEAAYRAHRLGRWTFAGALAADGDERGRIARACRRYRALLARALRQAA